MDIFERLTTLGKKPVIAQIGGFRPEASIISSFGGDFYLHESDNWPSDQDGFMIPIIQIYVPEVPEGRKRFGDKRLIQVYLNSEKLPVDYAKNGEGWLLREYDSIEGMRKMKTPSECKQVKSFQIKWSEAGTPDFPCWEQSWDYLDMSEINESDELSDRFFNEFDRYFFTKIGGFPSYIQSPCLGDLDYIFQISSEEKPGFMIADNGKLYIAKSKDDGQWYLAWDSY
ncbi:DUF1963 domain-containing protein [Paenibacillus sp. 1001270B_150601_E10]|uniref:DUF1963 domain-containing protein n=1 Tax=Paenibacillus sp. 1001270B_150601_E10 TaxID=2787079 RepID=UPI001E498593|nr:DUF1963 domain-containing protein [Paenibacillus sp. 1001270B_150601_E10]